MAAHAEDTLLDRELADFPKSELWRFYTDGWQAYLGPDNFSSAFLDGIQAGFDYLREHIEDHITPELIEGMYQSAFKFEAEKLPEYERAQVKSYNLSSGGFKIVYQHEDSQPDADLSLEGLTEFCQALCSFSSQASVRKTRIDILLSHSIASCKFPFIIQITETGLTDRQFADALDPKKVSSLINEKFELTLSPQQIEPFLSSYLLLTKSEPPLAEILLYSTEPKDRDEMISLVQQDIDEFYRQLTIAYKHESIEVKDQAIILAINAFMRKLNQSHYFPDGNGRTFNFLLGNLLLLQHGLGLKMTSHPTHYAGFSSIQLYLETQADRELFQQLKITKIKPFIQQVCSKSDFKAETLRAKLNSNPLYAMAQLDEIVSQLHTEQMSCFDKPWVIEQLKQEYLLQLIQFIETENPDSPSLGGASLYFDENENLTEFPPAKVLASIIAKHDIAKSMKTAPLIEQYQVKTSAPRASSSSTTEYRSEVSSIREGELSASSAASLSGKK